VISIALAFGAAVLFGLALVLTQLGLRDVPALAGAAISIPSSTLLFACVTPIAQEQLVGGHVRCLVLARMHGLSRIAKGPDAALQAAAARG
jgi:hypothetical protein